MKSGKFFVFLLVICTIFLGALTYGAMSAEVVDKQKLSLRKSVASEQFLDLSGARCLEALDKCQERIMKAAKSATCTPSTEREAELEREVSALRAQNAQYFRLIQCIKTKDLKCLENFSFSE